MGVIECVSVARIILVEADAQRRGALAERLGKAGHSVVAFAASEPALEQLAAAELADVLLLDWWMPARWPLLLERERHARLAGLKVVGIQRPAEPDEILSAVEAILAGEPLAPIVPLRQHPLARLAARLSSLTARLPDSAPGHPELDAAIALARRGAARAEAFARYAATFGRSRGGGDAPQPIDLRRILSRAIDLALPELEGRAQLNLSLAAVPTVMAREWELGHACYHLIMNATQAIPEGAPGEHRVEVATSTDRAGFAVVEVIDSGPGIPLEHLAHVFEPFFTTKGGRGVGLGLYLCWCTVAAHEGQLTVESTPGRTSFRIALPPLGPGLA